MATWQTGKKPCRVYLFRKAETLNREKRIVYFSSNEARTLTARSCTEKGFLYEIHAFIQNSPV